MDPSEAKGFMLDTNIFNRVETGDVPVEAFQGRRMFATHVQRNELENTTADHKRSRLLAVLQAIGPTDISTSSALWDVSEWDAAKWSDEDEVFESILKRVKKHDKAQRKKPRSEANQQRDALIAETAIKEGLILVTDDTGLAAAAKEFGGTVMNLQEFLAKG